MGFCLPLAKGSIEATDSSVLSLSGLRTSFPFYVDTPGGNVSLFSREQLYMVARVRHNLDNSSKRKRHQHRVQLCYRNNMSNYLDQRNAI
jgi:hypothetical protein